METVSSGVEVWQNVTRGRVVVLKFDRRGDLEHEMVRPGGTISLKTEERLLNMDRAANDKLDVFKNGFLAPVRLLDGTEDAADIASNPNLMGESELRGLFKLHWKKFEAQVQEITNTTTLERLLAVANDVDATVKQVAVIESQITALKPEAEKPRDEGMKHAPDAAFPAVTPR